MRGSCRNAQLVRMPAVLPLPTSIESTPRDNQVPRVCSGSGRSEAAGTSAAVSVQGAQGGAW